MPPISLYIHIPFCQRKCPYCDFNTYAGLNRLFEPFTAALVKEIMENAFKFPGVTFDVPLDAEAGTGPSWASAH